MSEIKILNPPGALIVSEIEPLSPAMRAGVAVGDLLREINGKPILDILDYQYYSADERLKMVFERDGQRYVVALKNYDNRGTGLSFVSDLGDKIHTCNNKCVFCFIHQMPKKMRKTLYLMDDDFRLSFMHGNYVTLTNVNDTEFARIIEQKLSPLYVSVHATDPELRGVLLGKKEPQPILPRIRILADNRIDVHAQIVLCPGINDGEALHKTLNELAAEHRMSTNKRAGVQSAAIVPVGLTRFRERLPKLDTADRDYARAMIDDIRKLTNGFKRDLDTRFAWLSDEWYTLAELPVPGTQHYEEFPQLEDGIGTIRLFLDNLKSLDRRLPTRAETPVDATLVTSELPAPYLQILVDRLNQIENVSVNLCVVKNEFFGGGINIAGLLTATDIMEQLSLFPVGSVVYVPSICLRDESVFLDDFTVEEVREKTGLDIRVTGTKPRDLVTRMGLMAPARSRSPWPGLGRVMEEERV